MKATLALLFGFLVLERFAFAGVDTDIAETNRAILSSGRWKPSAEETQKALVAIQSFLQMPNTTNDWTKSEITQVREHAKEYRVQFVGDDREARKVISCHFLLAPRTGDLDLCPDWRRSLCDVDDGGCSFWHIDYDPSTAKCMG
jgi:hypothetical protein